MLSFKTREDCHHRRPAYSQIMSTNNNRLGKEVQPIWKDDESRSCRIKKLSTEKIQRLLQDGRNVSDITAASLSDRGIEFIEDMSGFSSLRRLDLSGNNLKRLQNVRCLRNLGMLNVSNNAFVGGEAALEELRYLTELRTLNIGDNPGVGKLKKYILQSLPNLHALISHNCGLTSTSFLTHSTSLGTLILSKNKLTDFPRLGHNNFINLQKLSLGHNSLCTMPQLDFCPHLQELRVNNNSIGYISESVLLTPQLKTLDISCNQISSWSSIEVLTGLQRLTNLAANGNPLPPPPPETEDFVLREDLSADKIKDVNQIRYRRHVLGLFQVRVGKEQKLKIRLIVLDMKRVKAKWSHKSTVAPDITPGNKSIVSSSKRTDFHAQDSKMAKGNAEFREHSSSSGQTPQVAQTKKAKDKSPGATAENKLIILDNQDLSLGSKRKASLIEDEGEQGNRLGVDTSTLSRSQQEAKAPVTTEDEEVPPPIKSKGLESGVVKICSLNNSKEIRNNKKVKMHASTTIPMGTSATVTVSDLLFGSTSAAASDGWD